MAQKLDPKVSGFVLLSLQSRPASVAVVQVATQMAHSMGSLLCLNVPPGTRFGIDSLSWTTGEKFQGVKMIPTGVHYISYRYLQ
jgi:hypothetical protein